MSFMKKNDRELKDGGPAFPRTEKVRDTASWPSPEYTEKQYFGMSVRDHFASNAIAGIMASSEWFEAIMDAKTKTKRKMTHIAAIMAYEVADAMLSHRKGEKIDRKDQS